MGDPVAAVAAVDEATAEEALNLIDVEYDELPAVTSIEEALAPDAPLVHDRSSSGGEMMGQHYEAPKEFAGSNLCYRFSYAKGNVEEGFRKRITFLKTPLDFRECSTFLWSPMRPWPMWMGITSRCGPERRSRLRLREHLSEIFHLPLNKIRVIVPYLGGAYGGKLAVKTEPIGSGPVTEGQAAGSPRPLHRREL